MSLDASISYAIAPQIPIFIHIFSIGCLSQFTWLTKQQIKNGGYNHGYPHAAMDIDIWLQAVHPRRNLKCTVISVVLLSMPLRILYRSDKTIVKYDDAEYHG